MKRLLLIVLLVSSLTVFGQGEKYKITEEDYDNNQVEMADVMRENGKIYVVVGCILIIFGAITFYLYNLDKKVTKLEREFDEH